MADTPILSSPLSFTGSAQRLWRPVKTARSAGAKWVLGTALVFLIGMVWLFVACWYLMWGILVVPWRLLRRGQRRDKWTARQLEEQRKAIAAQQRSPEHRLREW